MTDVSGKFFSAKKVRTGVSPSSPGVQVGETLPPVNPPGTSLNSVGLTMPSAFAVANSPLTSNGTIAVTGAGTVAQYVRGDGSLADFPESSGGGSSVSYYLNGSVSQGTIGGVAYLEMNKVPILGAGTDFTIAANGYIASFITDAGDPNLVEIPGGNWNFESYFSASSGGGSPTFYVELYKVNAGGTATLIASSSAIPELIAFGTNITPYFSSLAVPTTVLALTDRLAVRYYVTHSGRTITLHTEGPHLCQIITTFTTGLTSLNGLNAQVQFFAVGTSGTDFAIASATATHTFNLPTASATNRGALSSADWTTFNNKTSNLGTVTSVAATAGTGISVSGSPITTSGTLTITNTAPDQVVALTASTGISVSGTYPNFTITNTSPSSGGTVTSVGLSSATSGVTIGSTPVTTSGTITIAIATASGSLNGLLSSTDWTNFNGKQNALNGTGFVKISGTTISYDNTNYLPLTGGTLTGQLNGTSIILSGDITANRYRGVNSLVLNSYTTVNPSSNVYLYSPGNDRDAWIYLDSADTGSNWGIYHRQIDSAVGGLPGNSIGFIGAGTNTLQAWISLLNGEGFFAGSLTASNLSGTNTGNVTIGTANGLSLSTQVLSLGLASAGVTGALSGTDWTTFNGKQNALTNPVTGTGTTNYLPKFTGASTIGDSNIVQSGIYSSFGTTVTLGNVTINQTTGENGLVVNSTIAETPTLYLRDAGGNGYSRILANNNLVLDASKVLIGTTTDAGFKLDVNGTGRFTSSVITEGNITIRTTNSPAQNILLNAIPANDNTIALISFGARYNATTYGTGAQIRASAAGTWSSTNYGSNLTFSTVTQNTDVNTERMRILANGNIGIGTINPTTFSGNTTLSINNSAGGAVLELQSNATSAFRMACSSADAALWEPRNVPILIATNNTERMRITSGGNIGIGTDSPNVKLHVTDKGLVRTGESSWGQFAVANPNDAEVGITWGAGGTGYPGITSTYTRQWIAGINPFGTGLDRWSLTNKTLGANAAITVRENGDLGIGNINPDSRLHVYKGGDNWHVIFDGGTGQLRFGAEAGSGAVIQSRTPAGTSRPLYLQRDGGNVLIGTTSDSGDRLRVNGTTFTNEIMTYNPQNDNRSGVNWRLGAASIGTDTLNRRLRVNVGGVEYYIGAVEV